MFDYWLWRRERRIHAAAAFWPASLLALPGILIDGRFLPLVYNTIAARGDRHVAAGPFWASNEMFEVWDSCFCFNVDFFVSAERHCRIGVEYSGLDGKKVTLAAEGELSELLQHEIDHLDGILATDRMRNRKGIMMRSEWEKLFGLHNSGVV